MSIEIERKFLVDKKLWNKLNKPQGKLLRQSYLSTDPDKTIRIRIIGEKALIGIKGKTKGISRSEYEYEIPMEDALHMMDEFGDKGIEKIRYIIPIEQHIWEVDVFKGTNEGLILAEIELSSENEIFHKPEWLLDEVSADPKYFNAVLQENPYSMW